MSDILLTNIAFAGRKGGQSRVREYRRHPLDQHCVVSQNYR